MDSPSKYRARVRVLMLATCSGAKRGANSITTRPPGNSTYSVLSGSSGRQSAGVEAARTSAMLGCLAAGAGRPIKKASAHGIKNLRLRSMHQVLHKSASRLAEGRMRRILVSMPCVAGVAWRRANAPWQRSGVSGRRRPDAGRAGRHGQAGGMGQPATRSPSTPSTEKPDAAAKKAFNAGVKSLATAHEFEEVAAKATNPDKKAGALDKVGDAYGKALDQFTEALSNKGDMVEAWNQCGLHASAPGRVTTNRSTTTTIRWRSSRICSRPSSIAPRPIWRSIGWRKRRPRTWICSTTRARWRIN